MSTPEPTERTRMTAGDAVLVTGSSTGLGMETALHLAVSGFRVFASLRDLAGAPKLQQAAADRGVRLDVIQLDVTDRNSIEAAAAEIEAKAGRLFGLVNNAGIGLRGCLEDLSEDEIRDVFEANVFGTINVTKRFLPAMREAGRGRIVTISSVGGRISSFGLSIYCASKFTLEGWSEALDLEVQPFGLRAVLIEPGIINTTRWNVHRGTAAKAGDPSGPYYALFKRSEAVADRLVDRSRTRPEDVAAAVYKALTAKRPRLRYVVGRPAAAAILLKRYLPEPIFERVYFGSFLKQITSEQASTKG